KKVTVGGLERSNDARRVRGKEAQAADERRVRERGAGDAEHEQHPDLARIRCRRYRRCERKRQNRRRGVLPERDRTCRVPGGERTVADREQREREAGNDAPGQPLDDAILERERWHDEQETRRDSGG